jgi:type IV secretory pathway VirB2 component (pilin)
MEAATISGPLWIIIAVVAIVIIALLLFRGRR